MKKYRIIIIPVLTLGLILGSCTQDLLDIEQKNVLEQDAFYSNADDDQALELMASVYRNCYTQGRYMYDDIILNCLSDDNWFSQDNSAVAMEQFDDFTVTSDNTYLSDIYSHYYTINYYCNLIIEKLPDDTEVKQRVIAEAKAIRAWVYINLIRYWGTPPLVDHVITSAEAQELTNDTQADLWNYVETSLTEAAAVLPSKDSKDGQAAIGGRLTKEACYALLGKAKIWQSDYSSAETYLKKVIDSQLYELIPVENLYHPAGDFNAEYLWEFNANDANTANYTSQNQTYKALFYGWRSDAVRIPDQMITIGWGFGSPSKNFGEFLAEFDVTSTGERSPRAKTLIIDQDQIYTEGSLTFSGEALDESLSFVTAAPVNNCAGYFRLREISWADDMFPTTSLFTTYSMTNIPYIRYAEVLLLYAEACLQTGSTTDGLAALNEVRTRAGIPTLSSYTLTDVKNEKRAEMYWEPERFSDLVRWGDAATVLADEGKLHYQFWGYEDDGTTWDIRTTTGTNQNGFTAGKNELLPFPASELYAAPNIVQNTGY